MQQTAKRGLNWFLVITFVFFFFILVSGFVAINFVFAEIPLQSKLTTEQTEFKFIKTLWRGSRGDDVKRLQEFLKQSPEIYPEGLVTGYFGPLTEKAVKRFQVKNGIESIGIVGPKTRRKLNELILVKPIPIKEKSGSEEKKETPPIVFPNLTPPVAWPDWLKKEWENNIEDVRKFEEEVKKWSWKSLQNEDLPQLLQWADENKIRIIRSGPVLDVAEGSLIAVPGVNEVFKGFKAIPPHLIKVLENETVNLVSNLESSGGCWAYGTAAVVNIGVKEEIKMKVNFALCRPFDAGIVAHEVGHIVDEIKIRNIKGNEFSFGQTDEKIRVLREEYDRIFQVSEEYQRMYSERLFTLPPPGFISIYATRSESENFADHFRDYIFGAQYFRERAVKEPLLAQKYEFLKTKIFLGKEY